MAVLKLQPPRAVVEALLIEIQVGRQALFIQVGLGSPTSIDGVWKNNTGKGTSVSVIMWTSAPCGAPPTIIIIIIINFTLPAQAGLWAA
jgi:hypothetical protein